MNQSLRYFFLCFLNLLCWSGFAQRQRVQHLPYKDMEELNYGFFVGVNSQDLSFSHTGNVGPTGESWYVEQPQLSFGLSVGLLLDWCFVSNFHLRFSPSLHMGNRDLLLREENTGNTIRQDLKSNQIALPLSLKYTAHRVNNYKPYVSLGMAPAFDLSKQTQTPLVLKRFDLSFEVALGCDLYLPYFKLIPELRFSFGLLDLIKRNRSDLTDPMLIKYTEAIQKASSRQVSLIFYFE